MAVIATSDAELLRFQRDTDALESMCNLVIGRRSGGMCYLSDDWQTVHALLTPPATPPQLPTGALLLGEIVYEGVSDPTHAIGLRMTKQFARCLTEVDRATLQKRFDHALRASGSGGSLGRMQAALFRGAGTRGQRDAAFSEKMGVLQRLCEYATRAAECGEGLIFCRFEDW